MAVREPRSANDYDDRTTEAVRSVLIEVGQTLGSFQGKFAVIGGAVPWILLREAEMPHIGTQDIDLSLDAEALGDGEYVNLVEALQGRAIDSGKISDAFNSYARFPPAIQGRTSTSS